MLIISLVPCVLACGSEQDAAGGHGNVEITAWGEDYIESGLPAEGFADGWSVTYQKFLVSIGQIVVADSKGTIAGELPELQVLDMTRPGPHTLGTLANLPAKNWDRMSYAIAPPGATAQVHATATSADLELLQQKGYGVYFEATAKKGTLEKSLSWGFTQKTTYKECKGDLDGKETHGAVVTNGGTDTIELTLHGDHPYYDDLASPDAVLRFAPISAADSPEDGVVGLDELAKVKLSTIPDGTYGVGAANIDDLGAFVIALASTIGHFRGEGECVSQRE
ncbi:MAG: hypothetical protein IPM35_15100 [Myxococcales bacterium]|nr:hypothetical protein [Myxococcales bacterium]